MMQESDVVLVDIDHRGTATVTLNRPALRNAYDRALLEGLSAALVRLREDPAARLVLLRGSGTHFQAGADLGFLRALASGPADANLAFSQLTVRAVHELAVFPKPTIALVHGGCFGGGVGLVAACDMAIAESDVVFAVSEVRWGITPAPILPELVAALGVRPLARYALTAERFDAHEALRIGLIHEVCVPGALDRTAAPLVDALLMAAPEAVAMTKRLLHEARRRLDDTDFLQALAAEAASRRHSAEAAEGLASFAERRPPRWYSGDAS
jgi:methylglutaconyl-CoA hydratase